MDDLAAAVALAAFQDMNCESAQIVAGILQGSKVRQFYSKCGFVNKMPVYLEKLC